MYNMIERFKLGMLGLLAIVLFPVTVFGYLISAFSKKRWWMIPSNWRHWRRWIYKK